MRLSRVATALFLCLVLPAASAARADDGIFGSRDAQRSVLDDQVHEGWELDGYGGPSFRSYTLSSTSGFSAQLPSSLGFTAGLDALYRPIGSSVQWLVSFQHQATYFSNIPSVNPTSLTTLDDWATIGALFQPWQSVEALQLGVGVSMNSVDVPQTQPGAVETSYMQAGPSLMARYTDSLSSRLHYRVGFDLMTPFYMREFYQNTGSRYLALDYQLTAEITTPITEKIDLGIRFYGYLETADYQGAGQRDPGNPTINGTESLWVYGIPVEIRIKF